MLGVEKNNLCIKKNSQCINLKLKSQYLAQDKNGYNVWNQVIKDEEWKADETALILCDVWDKHWSRGADERLFVMLPAMNELIKYLREKGVLIVHAPSDTMEYYSQHPARLRILECPVVDIPEVVERPDYPLPVDASDQGSDTDDKPHIAWTCQHPMIFIDEERDVISDDGSEIFSFFHHKCIKNVFMMGVHTNMCILHRTFAIKAMVRRGFNPVLVRDLTDSMYNPEKPPYVSHEEGTRLVIEYIEKFWCPTVLSKDIK